MENLHIPITGDSSNFRSALQSARDGVRQTAKQIEDSGMTIEQMFDRIKVAAAASLAGFSVKEFASKVMEVRGEFQKLEVAFNTMLGSAEKADALMQQLVKTAAITPFDLKGVADGAKQLMAYGTAAEEVNDTLIHLGDIAAGLSIPLGDLVMLYGTTMTQGRMFTQDLRQFMGRGIPLAEELAKQFGVTKDKVGELVTAGKVGAEEFKKAIMAMSSEGGKFSGLMEAQSKTISGQISNIEDAIDTMFNNIGKQSEGIINGALSTISSLVENYETVGRVIMGLVVTYGVYKTAVMTVTALESFRTKNLALQAVGLQGVTAAEAIHYHWLVLTQKAQTLLNATMLANPYVAVAVAVAAVTAALISLGSEQDRVNAAYDEYMRKKDEAIRKEEEHKRKIDELIQTAGDESLSTDTRRKALFKLEEKYPDIFKKYATEIEMLKHIRDIKAEIAILDGQTSLSNPVNELAEVDKRIAELQKKGAWSLASTNSYAGTHTNSRTRSEEEELQAKLRRRRELAKEIEKDRGETYLTNLTGVSNGSLQLQINERKNLLAQMDVEEKKFGKVKFGGATGVYDRKTIEAQLQKLEREQNRRAQIVKDGSKDFVAEANKAYAEQKVALQQLEALHDPLKRAASDMTIDGKKVKDMGSDEFLAAIEKQQKAVDEAKKKVDAYNKARNGGSASTSKQDSAAKEDAARREREFEQELSDRERQAKQLEAMKDAQTAATIANEQNRARRELMQIEKDHDDALAAIDRQAEEMRKANYEAEKKAWEAANTDKTKSWSDTATAKDVEANGYANIQLTQEQMATLKALRDKENADYARSEEERLKQLTAAHQSYTDKKKALDKKYKEDIEAINAEIARAESRGDKEAAEALKRSRIETLKDYAKEQSALSLEQLKETPDYIRAFEDLENTSTETLEHLIKEFENVKSSAATNLAPTELREITKTIEQMKDALNSRNPFKQLSASLKELNAATNKLDWSKLQLLQAEADLKAVQNGEKVVAGIGFDKKTGQTYTIYLDEEEALKRVEKATEGVREANDELHNSQNKVNKSVTQVISEYRDLGNAIGDLGSQFDGLAGKIMSATGEVIGFATEGADAIAKVSAGIKEGMSALESASLILTAISAGMKIMNTISSLFGGDDEAEERKYQALLERLDKRLEVTNERISELNDTLDKSYGGEAENVAEEMRQTLLTAMGQLKDSILTQRYEDWNNLTPNIILSDIAKDYGLNNNGNFITSFRDVFKENSIEDVAKTFAKFRKDQPVIWADLISNCEEYGDEIEKLADKWEEFYKTFDKERERILGTNIDSLTSDMLSSLYDLADGAEDVTESVAENFEKMMNRMVINAVIAEELKKELTGYIDAWKDAYDNDDDIDSTERENLRKMYNDIYEKYAQRIQELTNDGIIKGTNGSTTKYFAGLRDSFVSTLTDMEDDAESWKDDILRTMFEDLVNKNVVNRQLWVNQGKDQFGDDIIMYYANLEEYLEHWTERYNAVLNNQYIGEQERAAKLKELMDELAGVREDAEKAAEEIADGIGYSKEISNALDNLKDSFVDAMLDMDMDAEKFGKQIGQTLIKEMLQEMLASGAYADQMKAIKELWQKVLESDNGRYWDEEGKYGEAGVSYTLENIQAMVTSLFNTISQDKSISQWVDQWKELEKAADDTFTSMSDSFVSALMDMDGDIEDFANNMKKTIVQKLVEAFMVSEKIKPILDGLQNTFNDIMADENLSPAERAAKIGAAIDAALPAETLQGLQDTVKHLLESIGYQFKEVETLFSNLGDTILESLLDVSSGVEGFMDSITQTITEDLVKSYMATDEFQDGLKTVKDDLEAAVKALADAKTPEEIAAAEEQLKNAKKAAEDFYNEAVDGTKRFTDALKKIENDTTFKDMTGNWVSNLMDFNATAEDWAEEIGQTMAQKIIEQMIVPTMIQPLLDNIQKAFNDAMATNTTSDAEGNAVYNWKGVLNDEGLKASITALQDAYPELKDVVQQILSLSGVKPDFSNSLDSIGDTLLDRLLSLDDDVEDIGKQIGQTLIREMLEQMLSTGQYADRIAAIKKMWQAILTGEDTEHTIEDVLKDIEQLENDITNPENSDFSGLIAKYKSLADVAKEGFSDLRGAFLSSLIDMNGDAETFGKSIGRTMLEQMLDAYVERTYKEQIAAINKEWAEALQSGNTDALERIKQKVQELYSTISTDVEVSNIADAIKELDKQLDTTFSDMADSWASALMDMEGTAEDWAQTVGKMIAEKIIKSMVIPTMIQPLLNDMQKAWNAAAEQEGATYQTMLDAMMPYLSDLVGAYEELRPIADYILNSLGVYKETVEEVAEEVEYHLQDLKSNFVSSLMDMEQSAEDWSESISKIMAEAFIKDFVLGDAFDAQMKDWQAHYESILNSGLSEEDRLKQMKLLRDAIVSAKEGYVEQAMAIQELMGLNAASSSQSATANIADKITYEQADMGLGMLMALVMNSEQMLATVRGGVTVFNGGDAASYQAKMATANGEETGRQIESMLLGLANLNIPDGDTVREIRGLIIIGNSYLYDIKTSNEQMLRQFGERLESIDNKIGQIF